MAALAASGWAALLTYRPRWLQIGGFALLMAGLVNVMAFNVRSYPNQAVTSTSLRVARAARLAGPARLLGQLRAAGRRMVRGPARRAQMPVRVWGHPEHLVRTTQRAFMDWSDTR